MGMGFCPTRASRAWEPRYEQPQPRGTGYLRNALFGKVYLGLWNKIPHYIYIIYITDLPKKTFQRVLRKLLFDIFEKEDDFIQIPVIIKKASLCRYMLDQTLFCFPFLCFDVLLFIFKNDSLDLLTAD